MQFHTLVGILPHELEHPQPLEIDLTVWMSSVDAVVDYRKLYDDVRAALTASDHGYLETIADAICTRVFVQHERVGSARVRLRKPHVTLGGPLAYAEVVVTRERDA